MTVTVLGADPEPVDGDSRVGNSDGNQPHHPARWLR